MADGAPVVTLHVTGAAPDTDMLPRRGRCETAACLRVSRSTVHRLIRAGELDAIRINARVIHIPADAIRDFMAASAVPPGPAAPAGQAGPAPAPHPGPTRPVNRPGQEGPVGLGRQGPVRVGRNGLLGRLAVPGVSWCRPATFLRLDVQ
jgi:excisionase family DNA binding protein